MAQGLERPERSAELLAHLQVLDRHLDAALGGTGRLAGQRDEEEVARP